MSDIPIKHDIRCGYLGWSNVRAGLEFYRADGNNNRWVPRQSKMFVDQNPTSGALLQDDICESAGLGEGCVCVVITMGTRDLAIASRLAEELVSAFQREKEPPR